MSTSQSTSQTKVTVSTSATKPKRNTHAIGFNNEEYALIKQKAEAAGLYPRQYILMRAQADK